MFRYSIHMECLRYVGVVIVMLVGSVAHASEVCGQRTDAMDYGSVDVGTQVVLGRHRYVRGDPNWSPTMDSYLGLTTTVTQRVGLDARGCPGVRVSADGQTHFWRVRDLHLQEHGTVPPVFAHSAPGSTQPLPKECTPGGSPNYGPLRLGSRVRLGRHDRVMGVDNWNAEMEAWVGRETTVTRLLGADGSGCPGMSVDIDHGQYFWRIRNSELVGGGASGVATSLSQMPARMSTALDHGRPDFSGINPNDLLGEVAIATPQECGLTDATANFGSMKIGSEVRISRHRVVDGHDNWDSTMDPLVGNTTKVVAMIGVDEQGCPVVHLEADSGAHFWRVRDLTVIGTAGGVGASYFSPGFSPDPRIFRGTSGSDRQAGSLNSGCEGMIGNQPSHVIQLGSQMTLRVVVQSASDTVLVIQHPDGSFKCDDDSDGPNPIVSGSFAAGEHKIYVGSFEPGNTATYTLGVTTQMGLGSAQLPSP